MRGKADLILTGGQVQVMDRAGQVAPGLALADGRVLALGDWSALRPLAGPRTEVIDLAGACVLPGIHDAHLHGAWTGARWPDLMLQAPGVDWHGPTLDGPEATEAAILRMGALAVSLGMTSYLEPGLGAGEDSGPTGCFGTPVIAAYRRLAERGALAARVGVLGLFGLLDGPSRLETVLDGIAAWPRSDTGPEMLLNRGIKIFADGIPPLATAWTTDAYVDGSHGGLMTGEGDTAERLHAFESMVEAAHRRGLAVGVHATGDNTVEAFVALIERLGGAQGRAHHVIHGEMATSAQLARMARAGIGLAMQPLIAVQTRSWMTGKVRPEVVARMWPIEAMMDERLACAITSDAPVASPDWRLSLAAMAGLLGPAAGAAAMPRLLRMVTALSAVLDGTADWRGTLAPGQVADLCVIETDPVQAGPQALPGLAILCTMVGGRTVFRAP